MSRARSVETIEEDNNKMYDRQQVFEAILRGKKIDNKRVWREHTIISSAEGRKKRVPVTEELQANLILREANEPPNINIKTGTLDGSTSHVSTIIVPSPKIRQNPNTKKELVKKAKIKPIKSPKIKEAWF